jgi:pyrroloquinoline quinone biosynthesis protein B
MKIFSFSSYCFFVFFVSNLFAQASQQDDPFLIVLGTAQDGGYPHAGCNRECCRAYYDGKETPHFVSSLAIVDPVSGERFLFDCTPDFPAQLHLLDSIIQTIKMVDGIFLTHAHIGHYTGLMYLGREVMNAKDVKVYAMEDMEHFLENNGPWSLLIELNNIEIHTLNADSTIRLNERITVTPFNVPHRHEFTTAVGYKIVAGNKSVIFIPDIDKWTSWDHDISQLVKENDFLFLDGTFYKNGEIPGRNMSEIPHPFIEETMALLETLPGMEKSKVWFIHMNHTNPALLHDSDARKDIQNKGFKVASEGMVIKL